MFYIGWLQQKIILSLPENSVVVMDIAVSYRVQTDRQATYC
jgi:hypothetical protein